MYFHVVTSAFYLPLQKMLKFEGWCIEKSHQEFTVLSMLAWKRTLNEDDGDDDVHNNLRNYLRIAPLEGE